MSSCSAVKKNTGNSLFISCAALPPSSLKLEQNHWWIKSLPQAAQNLILLRPMLHLQKQNTANTEHCKHSGLQMKQEMCCFFKITTIVFHHGIHYLYSLSPSPFAHSHSLAPHLELLINLEEDTDVTIDNVVNNNSLKSALMMMMTMSTTVPFKSAAIKRLGRQFV